MTALSYAIEPGDAWYFNQLDREQAADEAKEHFVNQFKDQIAQPSFLLNRIGEERAYDTFDNALQAIYDDAQKGTAFHRALHSLWVHPGNDDYSKAVSQMIQAELNRIAEKEFEKNPGLFDW